MCETPCSAFYWGSGCTTLCTCEQDKSTGCDASTGVCTCKDGFEGDDCERVRVNSKEHTLKKRLT